MKFGATGRFPRGKLRSDDEGELQLAVAHDKKGNVHLHFGKAITWFAMPSHEAMQLAELLVDHARKATNEQLK
jgi:hypothetical protein